MLRRARRGPRPRLPRVAVPGGKSGRVVALVAVAALIGGLLGGGVVAAIKGDRKTTVIERTVTDTPARAATQISKPGDVAAILAKVQPAVVRIDVGVSSNSEEQGTGTGFIISSDGVIVTNAHVASGTSSLDVTLNDGDKVPATLLGRRHGLRPGGREDRPHRSPHDRAR